jgi:hypothetical protein
MTIAVELAKKFCVFHQRDVGKSAYIAEGSSPAENAVIAASHSQQDACVMSKTVCESINQAWRQANSEITANDLWIIHDAPDLIQTLQWQFGIDMNKPKDLPARDTRADIHLPATPASALNEPIAKSSSESICAIGASPVHDHDFGFWRSLAQMLKKRPYQRRLVEYGDNDRDLCPDAFLRIACRKAITRSCLC